MLVIPAILEGYRSLKDKTFHVHFGTNELSPDKVTELHLALQQFGYLAFKADPFKTDELSIIDSLEADYDDGQKKPSQRLRAVFYRLWEQDQEGYKDFNLYYEFQMEKIIKHFKSKLP